MTLKFSRKHLGLAFLATGILTACNGGGSSYTSSWVSPSAPGESPPVTPNTAQWTTMVGESDFLKNGNGYTQFLSYDSKNNVIVGSAFGTILSTGINEYYLNQGYDSIWQYGIDAKIFQWGLDGVSNVTTDNNGMFYLFAGLYDYGLIGKYLISFNDKTQELHYHELSGNYPADVDFSNIYYYNGSVYAEESTLGTNTTYNYNLVSFSVESSNFGTYESTLNNVYASNSLWLTKTSYVYMVNNHDSLGHYYRTPVISAVIGDNGNMYVNDHGRIAEIPLNNPANIRQIGIQLGDNYSESSVVKYAGDEPYFSPIAYNNGKIYACGQVGDDYRVNVIVSLPITANTEQQWEPIGYTWHFSNSGIGNYYVGCDSITANGNKIFVEGGYGVYVRAGGGGVAVYESDIQ